MRNTPARGNQNFRPETTSSTPKTTAKAKIWMTSTIPRPTMSGSSKKWRCRIPVAMK